MRAAEVLLHSTADRSAWYDRGMVDHAKHRPTLRRMMMATVWFSAAFAMWRPAVAEFNDWAQFRDGVNYGQLLVALAVVFVGAGIGALCGRTRLGAFLAIPVGLFVSYGFEFY